MRCLRNLCKTSCWITTTKGHWRAPGDEEVSKPRAYKAFGFRDFFKSGLQFPSKEFVGAILVKFKVQMHQWTPNAFARLSVFAMALKMGGCVPSADCFAHFYNLHLAK